MICCSIEKARFDPSEGLPDSYEDNLPLQNKLDDLPAASTGTSSTVGK